MKKSLYLITLATLLVFLGCSSKEQEVKPKLKKILDVNKTIQVEEVKKTAKKVVEIPPSIEKNITQESYVMPVMVVEEAFVPEHIKRSHIEVVPH
jgi:PBP1b-binding outer membrane lipoprotein LpoB